MLERVKDSFLAFCDAFNVSLFAWQREAFGEFGRRVAGAFVHRVGGISVPRGDGKTHGEGAYGLFRMVTGRRGADHISVALDEDGSHLVLDYARQLRRRHPALQAAIEERANALLVPATGARWTAEPAPHLSTRGRHPAWVGYDEPGWASDDELFASLLAAQASVPDAQMLLVSTVGPARSGPLWKVKELGEAGEAFWYYRTSNQSPLVTVAFLEQQRRMLTRGQYRREHENQWVDASDAFTTSLEVGDAMGRGWRELLAGRRDVEASVGVDLGLVSDPSVVALAYREDGDAYVGRILAFAGTRETPVSLDAVERAIVELCRQWSVTVIRVESWQGASLVQRLQARGLPAQLVPPTPRLHATEWPVLGQLLSSRRLVLPCHEQLRAELLGLSSEVTATGLRVTDRGSVHQDHAVALRLAVCGLAAEDEMPLMLLFSPTSASWEGRQRGQADEERSGLPALSREARLTLWTSHIEPLLVAVQADDEVAAERAASALEAHIASVERRDPATGAAMRALVERLGIAAEEYRNGSLAPASVGSR